MITGQNSISKLMYPITHSILLSDEDPSSVKICSSFIKLPPNSASKI